MSSIRDLLSKAVTEGASDIHMKPDQSPFYRVSGEFVESGFEATDPAAMEAIVKEILPTHLVEPYETEYEADFSFVEPGVGRFRVNVFLAQHVPSITMRYVKTEVPSVTGLGLPAVVETFADARRGVILFSGTTGSGKSTTLAALIEKMNQGARRRVITIEDPVEFMFHDKECLITQREIGLDTVGFHEALKRVLRQDPDVIMIGEMRDSVSFMAALAAAETGHLVLSTVHAGNAQQGINRILDMFPSSERDQVRMSLAGNLHAIVCQRLVRAVRGGVVPACEIMINTPTIRKLLTKNRLDVLSAAIETGVEDGMQTFNQSIYQLVKSGVVSEAEGMRNASNPEALRMNLQGIFLDESRRILSDTA